MITFVHLAPEKSIKSILRSGIKTDKISHADISEGVFCMPLTNDYFATYQWLRELKRRGQNQFKAIHFKVSDDEEVWYGYYGYHDQKLKIKASEAVKLMMETKDKQGIEVIINRKINKSEIIKVINISNNVGWRYYPGSHNRHLCKCSGCISTRDFKGKQIFKKEYFKYLNQMRSATNVNDLNKALYGISEFISSKKRTYSLLQHFTPYLNHESPIIRMTIMDLLAQYFSKMSFVQVSIKNMCSDIDSDIRFGASKHLYYLYDVPFEEIINMFSKDNIVKEKLEEYYKIYIEDEDEDEDED